MASIRAGSAIRATSTLPPAKRPEHSALLLAHLTASPPATGPIQCQLCPHPQPATLVALASPPSRPRFLHPPPILSTQLFPYPPPQVLDNAYAATPLPGAPTLRPVRKPVLIGHGPVVQPPGRFLGLGALRQWGLESASSKATGGLWLGARPAPAAPPSSHKRPSPLAPSSQLVSSRARCW